MRTHTLLSLFITLLGTVVSSEEIPPTVQDLFDAGKKYALPYDPGFNIEKVVLRAIELPSHSWEYGTATEMLLELLDPDISVFGWAPFPVPYKDQDDVAGMAYAADKIVLGTGANGLSDGDGAVGDPASLGTGAVLLGKLQSKYADGADEEVEYITTEAPRFWNGAISHRVDVAELWYVALLWAELVNHKTDQ
jgi:hypothetical protein